MKTPICDFVKEYTKKSPLRMHMPGHKGASVLGVENIDITEIDGADDLYHADGIIKESELNAGSLFGANTFYSTEGSSLSIRAALYLAVKHAKAQGVRPIIAAGRNAHKVFLSSAALLDFDIVWLKPENCDNYLSCNIDAEYLDHALSLEKVKPIAVYITSPDYLGHITDIKAIKRVCDKYGCLLIIDNAHGAYLNFLSNNLHPISLGADICLDSAHKTLPALTGGAYLHISKSAPKNLVDGAKNALALFGSTSPSYLVLQSLDALNKILANDYKTKLNDTVLRIEKLKNLLTNSGYTLYGNEPLKITIVAKEYGYTGEELNTKLNEKNIFVEFYDPDFIVLMPTTNTTPSDFKRLEKALLSIKKRPPLSALPPRFQLPQKAISVRDALLSPSKTVDVNSALGKVLADISVSCPPAIPIVVSGEIIDQNSIELFKYYGIKSCEIIDE